jgi:glycosyltransferase involved in cell wall biosynthesis
MLIESNLEISLSNRLLIYIPAYNCARYLVSVLDEIPASFWDIADILIIDNCSTDGTVESVQKARLENRWPKPVHLIQPEKNLGYSGSQKLAYSIALESPATKRVIMLHGDGQYPPKLLNEFSPYLNSDFGLIYGYRDKSEYPQKEETPTGTYRVIKTLSAIESLVTGHIRKEWHTGFVMYSREFLERVDLDGLTDTYHIDGHLQFVSGELGIQVKAIPIWKRYKDYDQLKGLNRLTYIFHVLWLMVQFRLHGINATKTSGDSSVQRFSIIPDGGTENQ